MSSFSTVNSIILSLYKPDIYLCRDIFSLNIKLSYVFFSTNVYHTIITVTKRSCVFDNKIMRFRQETNEISEDVEFSISEQNIFR
jgi:hypothetical protein